MHSNMDMFRKNLVREAKELLPAYDRWVAFYAPGRVVFNRPDSAVHAADHCRRVLIHALLTGCAEFGADDAEALEILAHASLFHDTRRLDEGFDTGHGARAADYYAQYCSEHPDEISFHPEAEYLIRYHDLPDRMGYAAIEKEFGDNAGRVKRLYDVFKDADALDRPRLGPFGLDPMYLRTAKARESVPFAKKLVADTMNVEVYNEISGLVEETMGRRRAMLLVVDAQHDFIDGSLPVPGAATAMDGLARYIRDTDGQYTLKVFTADSHPASHCSFAGNGGEWPVHCVAGSHGAEIWPALKEAAESTAGKTVVLTKGTDVAREEYSIFANMKSAAVIEQLIDNYEIKRIDLCGLAGDVCVLQTLRDGVALYGRRMWRVLQPFSPSLDGGKLLKETIQTLCDK